MPLPLRMMPVSLRCRHGRCRHCPEPTRTHYGSSQILASSRIITDRPGFFKQFKISKNDLPDFPGPSRTFQDHPGPPRTITAALRTRDESSHGSPRIRSGAVHGGPGARGDRSLNNQFCYSGYVNLKLVCNFGSTL